MKCIGYNTNCSGAVTKSNQMDSSTVHMVTDLHVHVLCKVTVTKSYRTVANIVKKRPIVIHS